MSVEMDMFDLMLADAVQQASSEFIISALSLKQEAIGVSRFLNFDWQDVVT